MRRRVLLILLSFFVIAIVLGWQLIALSILANVNESETAPARTAENPQFGGNTPGSGKDFSGLIPGLGFPGNGPGTGDSSSSGTLDTGNPGNGPGSGDSSSSETLNTDNPGNGSGSGDSSSSDTLDTDNSANGPEIGPETSEDTGSEAGAGTEESDGACPACNGTGNLGNDVCPVCNGTGEISQGAVQPQLISPEGGLPAHVPLFQVSGAGDTSLLRSAVTSMYDGKIWRLDAGQTAQPYRGEILAPPVTAGYDYLKTDNIQVSPLSENASALPALSSLYPVSLVAKGSWTFFPEQLTFAAEEAITTPYTFKTSHYYFEESSLVAAEVDAPDVYLQLPPEITPRTADLARDIIRGVTSPYEKAMAIRDYLRSHYEYDVHYERAPQGREANDWFLFDEKKGVCANFNSAFVVLARAVGLPARLVAGYAITPQDTGQTVYADQAHAWAEVRFQDFGWITFDATGSGSGTDQEEPEDTTPGEEPSASDNSTGPVSTGTEITMISSPVRKGHAFSVRGTVTADDGTTIEGGPVEVFANEEKDTEGGILLGEGTVAGGNFDVQAVFPGENSVGDYQILAHFLGDTRYRHSWSDPEIKVVTDTSLTVAKHPSVTVKTPVSFQGSLREEFGESVAGQTVNIYLDNESVSTLETDAEGNFNWQQSFDQAGEHLLKVSFPGTEYRLESSQEQEVRAFIPAAIDLRVPEMAFIQEPVVIVGTLTDEANHVAVPDIPIQLSINGQPEAEELTTGTDGGFSVEHTFDSSGNYTIEASFGGVAYYTEAASTAVIGVYVPTVLTLKPPKKAIVRKATAFRGTLLEKISGNPVPNQSIHLSVDGKTSDETPVTDTDGAFQIDLIFDEVGQSRVEATYPGEAFFWKSAASVEIKVAAGFPWLSALIAALVAAAVIGGFFLYRRYGRDHPAPVLSPAPAAAAIPVAPPSGMALQIQFPQIKSPFPDVWGIGEPLEIEYRVVNGNRQDIAGRELVVDIDDEKMELRTDSEGRASLQRTFADKGPCQLAARLSGKKEGDVVAERALRIVDYREEIVDLFNALKDRIKKLGVIFPPHATPWEIVRETERNSREIPRGSMDRAVECFEEADYSLHRIDRTQYRRMYLAQRQIGNSGEPV